jgi:diketogulonate reductase-like aldo/keto reductase
MGERAHAVKDEVVALRFGHDLGLTLIDTSEMYADGRAEKIVAEAIQGRRDEAFIVSKVLPFNATARGTVTACERSLKRLKTDRIDLYLLHWRGSVPLEETVSAFERLKAAGKIRHWGVSNLDVSEMEELARLRGGGAVTANQVLYNLTRRGIEHDLVPWCRKRRVPIMAYSPIEQGRILRHKALGEIAKCRGTSPARVALAWLLHREGVVVISKASDLDHVRDNRAALDFALSVEDLAALDRAFPPPKGPRPLETL